MSETVSKRVYTNNARTVLYSAAPSYATTLEVEDGSRFPNPQAGEYFYVTLENDAGHIEICEVSGRNGNTLTGVVRGAQGTQALVHLAGTVVEHRVTAEDLANFLQGSETSVEGYLEKPLTSSITTLSETEAKNRTIKFVGTLTGAVTVFFPTSVLRSYVVQNATEGGFTVVLATVGADGVNLDTERSAVVFCDGVRLHEVAGTLSSELPLMAGMPSAGSALSASRWDHIHPTDTTRASVQQLQDEASARQVADQALTLALSSEQSERQAADTALQNSINQETSNRTAAISAETAARQASDVSLGNRIDTETSNRTAAISAEAAARQASDVSLGNRIDTETSNRTAAISAEAAARQAADVSLGNRIDTETSSRISADATLQNNITNEAGTRSAADSSLQSQINAIIGQFSFSHGNSGWQRLYNGILIQWGRGFSNGMSSPAYNNPFPIAFQEAVYSVVTTQGPDLTDTPNEHAFVSSMSTTSFDSRISISSTGSWPIMYVAIGK